MPEEQTVTPVDVPAARHDRRLGDREADESSEREQIARRHAEYYRDLFERAEREVAGAAYWRMPDGLRRGNR